MKKYINLIVFSALLLFVACESDLDNKIATAATPIDKFESDSYEAFKCDATNLKDTAYVLSWSDADFGENITSAYTLLLDLKGNDFKNAVELYAGTKSTERHVTSSELNATMHKLGQPIEVPTDLEIRLIAKPMVTGSAKPELPTVASKTAITLNITSYAMAPNHLVGDMFNTQAWNIKNYRFVMFRDDILEKDKYVSFFVKEPSSFKIVEDIGLGSWDTTYGRGAAGILSDKGGNISDIKTAGYYTVVVDLSELTYSITPYDIKDAKDYAELFLTGSATNAEVKMAKVKYDPHMWDADNVVLKAGEANFFSGSTKWSSTTFPYGLSGAKTGSIPVEEGTYYVRFSDLTGHYIFYKK